MSHQGIPLNFRILRDAGEVIRKLQRMYRSPIPYAVVRYEHVLEGLLKLFRYIEGYYKVGE